MTSSGRATGPTLASPSTTRLPGFLATRFGRRLFGVFVLSALLPITGLAVLAFVQVTDELHQQAERRLHSASRAAGMRVFDRLSALEVELAAMDSGLMDRAEADRIEPGRRERLARRFRAIWMVASGEVHDLLGDSREVPAIDFRGGQPRWCWSANAMDSRSTWRDVSSRHPRAP